MAVKEERKSAFISAMFNLTRSLKNEADLCCELCGGISEKELLIIVFVGRNQEVKMSDIADTLAAPLSTLTSIVDKLVEKKYLTRYHSAEDRRVIRVALGQNGKSAFKLFMSHKQNLASQVLSEFNEKEQVLLMNYLNKLAASLYSKK